MAKENAIIANNELDDLDSSAIPRAQNAQKIYEAGFDAACAGDSDKALELYRQAAHLGHRQSMSEMNQIYDFGRGVDPDPATAALWLQRFVQATDIREPNHMYWLVLSQYDLWPAAENEPFFERSPAETFAVLRLLLKQDPTSEIVSVATEYFFRGGKIMNDGAQLYLDYGDEVRLDIRTPQESFSLSKAFYVAQMAALRSMNDVGHWYDNVGAFEIEADDEGAFLRFNDGSGIALRPPLRPSGATRMLQMILGS